MAETIVPVLLIIAAAYLATGVLFTIPFQFKGLQKIDEGVHGASIGFRIIIIPGCILLWPALLRKWLQAARNQAGTNPKTVYPHK